MSNLTGSAIELKTFRTDFDVFNRHPAGDHVFEIEVSFNVRNLFSLFEEIFNRRTKPMSSLRNGQANTVPISNLN